MEHNRETFINLVIKSKKQKLNTDEVNIYNDLFQKLYLCKCERCNGENNSCISCGGSGIIGIAPYELRTQ